LKQFLKKIISPFRLEEFLFLFLFAPVLFLSLTISSHSFDLFTQEFITLSSAIILLFLSIFIKNRFFEILRECLPIIFFYSIYVNLYHLIPFLNPKDYDQILLKIDQFIFGIQPSVWMQKIMFKRLTDYLIICYSLFYFYPAIFALILYFKKGYPDFRKLANSLILCFYLGYIGYILVPAIGPRYTIKDQYTKPIEASVVTSNLLTTLDRLETTKRDCFPSLHNGITLLILLFAFKYQRKFFFIFLPIASGLFLGTIYLRVHYFVDLLAGFVLGLICFALSADLYKKWDENRIGV